MNEKEYRQRMLTLLLIAVIFTGLAASGMAWLVIQEAYYAFANHSNQ